MSPHASRLASLLTRRLSTTAHEEPKPAPRPPAPAPVVGIVEEFSRRLIVGWVSVPADSPPTRVDLFVGKLKLASTYATPGSSMSGITSVLRREPADGEEQGPGAADHAAAPRDPGLVHEWQVPGIPRPADDRRNSLQQIRTFSFRIRGIWPFVKKSTRITVRVNGRPLPIHGHGTYLLPPKSGRRSVAELGELLEQGHVLTQKGQVELSKQLDEKWQAEVIGLYDRTSEVLRERFGYDAFLVYGTLLGVVREGGYIGHDVDFDAAFLSQQHTGPDVAAEAVEVALALVEAGLDVDAHPTALHIFDPERPDTRIDLFHVYFDESGRLRFPFGIAGTSVVTEDDWQGTRHVEFRGGRGLVPVNAEQFVEHLYGPDWRNPKPGFNWNLDRTDSAPEGCLDEAALTKVYWANFYSRTGYDTGSTFFEFVQKLEETPDTIIDIGCGDGRDSRAFAAAGRTVLGLDQSQVGIAHASSRTAEGGVSGSARFRVCDVSDTDDLGRALDEGESGANGPKLFYMRFFLHAIPESVQVGLLDAIGSHARPGDQLAAEFRTDKDEQNLKVHLKHYRRFQNADAFVDDLEARGWIIVHREEGTGLSPYRDEDPVLCRVIARRP
ncbi:class I SAM-dependent methyltransferase [Nocardioides sp. MAHUQ-72]|uniref:class I SAM-dependent methyltransferase n=1 Tax=unclassified Nocardioides TaxID=2615069 RepID=UPI00360743E5